MGFLTEVNAASVANHCKGVWLVCKCHHDDYTQPSLHLAFEEASDTHRAALQHWALHSWAAVWSPNWPSGVMTLPGRPVAPPTLLSYLCSLICSPCFLPHPHIVQPQGHRAQSLHCSAQPQGPQKPQKKDQQAAARSESRECACHAGN